MSNYNIPDDIDQLFKEVYDNGGSMSYHIIDYAPEMEMDNIQSMNFFLEHLNIHADAVVEDLGTQVTLEHYSYYNKLVIDSGGLGDFFSHGFDCYWREEE